MTAKNFLAFILLAFFLNACGQPIEKSGKTEIEKKVETYVIEKTNPKYYHSIEFGEKKAFDLNQLIEDYENPNIFNDEPNAFKQNKEAFEWLKAFNNEANIAYSMTLTYGLKEKNSDAWDSYWVIVLFDSNNKIIGNFHYAP
jgi:hypothetical protein